MVIQSLIQLKELRNLDQRLFFLPINHIIRIVLGRVPPRRQLRPPLPNLIILAIPEPTQTTKPIRMILDIPIIIHMSAGQVDVFFVLLLRLLF